MTPFIQVCEVWVPHASRDYLVLHSGHYGDFTELADLSRTLLWSWGEGLPGRAWEAGEPVLLHDLNPAVFKRSDIAARLGLTCGFAIPVRAGEFLTGVIVFLCSDAAKAVGAFELWGATPDEPNYLGLLDGHYGRTQPFGDASRGQTFARGFGLPGKAWQSGLPELMTGLGSSPDFLRASQARQCGIDVGIAIPVGIDSDQPRIVALLSAPATPLARRVEIWTVDAEHESLVFHDGWCANVPRLDRVYDGVHLSRSDSTVGRAWRCGIPMVVNQLSASGSALGVAAVTAGLDTMVAIPVMDRGWVRAVVALYP
ncbi:GAF domain-containing protein [Derxia gummosa]|uniref:GAF domain-containing protein n=1 Tax=Derxia gummosa DSM 723 TaxID=1121388 RepID=A0A8B6X2X0_9BURK|nr:GAF domain-containing protein [Derxia gummosa]